MKNYVYWILGGIAIYAVAKYMKRKEETYSRIVKLLILSKIKDGYSALVVTEGSNGSIKVYDAETMKSLYAQALKDGAEIKAGDGIDLARDGFPVPDNSGDGSTRIVPPIRR